MPSIAVGVTIPRLSVHGATGGALTATLYDVQQYNIAQIAAYNYTLSDDVSIWGDSLTQGTGGRDPWSDWIAARITNTVNNEGIGGERLVDEIYGRLVLAGAGQKNDITCIEGGTNDASQDLVNTTYASLVTAFANCVAELTTSNYWVTTGTFGGSPSVGDTNGHDRSVTDQTLYDTYGDQFVYFMFPFFGAIAEASMTTAEKQQAFLGQMPTSLQADATHPGTPGIDALGSEFSRVAIALGGGAAYPHPDLVYLDEAASVGDTLHTMRRIGTPSSWEIVGADTADVVTIDSAGVIKRGTGTISRDYTNVRVRATSSDGAKQDAIVRLLRGGDGNFGGANIPQYGGFAIVEPGTFTDFTFLINMKYPVGEGGTCQLLTGTISGAVGSSYPSGTNRGKCQFTLKNSAGTTIVSSAPGPAPADEDDWYWIGISYSQSTSTCKVIANNTSQVKTVSLADNVSWGQYLMFFVGTSAYANSAPRDVRRLLVYDHYWDLASSTERAKFFNTTTLAPAAIGSGGEVDAITPVVGFDVHGVGDLMPSQWYGSATRKIWNQPWLDSLTYSGNP